MRLSLHLLSAERLEIICPYVLVPGLMMILPGFMQAPVICCHHHHPR